MIASYDHKLEFLTQISTTQSAGAVEYTDFFAERCKTPNQVVPGYDTKQSDVEVTVMPKP